MEKLIKHWENFSPLPISEFIDDILVTEEWRSIKGYENLYDVSNFGRVRSYPKNGGRTDFLIRVQLISNVGYLRVTLSKNGISGYKSVHRLVANAFIPNPENKPQVNHKKGVKTDNRELRLEWATRREDRLHAFKTGLSKQGEDHGKSKLTNEQALLIFKSKDKRRELAKKFGISMGEIKRIKLGQVWGHLTGKVYKAAENKTKAGLSNQDVLDIFNSKLKKQDIADRYSISLVSVRNIQAGVRWSHLTGKKYKCLK